VLKHKRRFRELGVGAEGPGVIQLTGQLIQTVGIVAGEVRRGSAAFAIRKGSLPGPPNRLPSSHF